MDRAIIGNSYLWKGALMGAAFNVGMAGLRIGALGTAFVPDPEVYCEVPDYGQAYRRGSIFMGGGSGITLGRNVAVKFTGNTNSDRCLLHHETGHLSQINDMGATKFTDVPQENMFVIYSAKVDFILYIQPLEH